MCAPPAAITTAAKCRRQKPEAGINFGQALRGRCDCGPRIDGFDRCDGRRCRPRRCRGRARPRGPAPSVREIYSAWRRSRARTPCLPSAGSSSPQRISVRQRRSRVRMEEKPSLALRRGRNTSMWRAIEAVKNGEAEVVVSAGNTGALMAMSMFQLGVIEGISRPAIAASVADHARPERGAGRRRQCRMRCRAAGRFRGDGRGLRARGSGPGAAAGRRCSMSASEEVKGQRRGARRRPRSCAMPRCRWSLTVSSKATISPRARWTWW